MSTLHFSNNVKLSKDNVEFDKAQLNDVVKAMTVTVDKSASNATPITASVPDGYKFLSWVHVGSSGGIVDGYFDNTLKTTTTIWSSSASAFSGLKFTGTYLVIKNVS